MPAIHEVATLTSKGQVTLPKAVRQLLGLNTGAKVAFDVRGSEVVVSRVQADHEDPAIGAFLDLLEADIRSGRNITALPDDLAQTMLANARHPVNLDEEIDGEVSL
ncbi:AbrB family transcriptional regulator [Pseudomonas sp. SG-MS2]|jgi:antitoxin PrlF|uniref:Type II toxin-antitoxin system PrlF family antitoxin n=1 Tax=Pseudomonas putida TaxID=303 RepID=A0A7Y7Z633_PSEPU|nr:MULTISPECIES: type II toxin-antitoxin system PrlF family antitoxin [Pseudomonas]KAF1310578.1 AbrB family transcriptional regulator [Pseudomonas sp. SG-MS2]NWC78976.1 type II toxin-antitoxin system PrlF family antitoxin [Pseudomonas putida]